MPNRAVIRLLAPLLSALPTVLAAQQVTPATPPARFPPPPKFFAEVNSTGWIVRAPNQRRAAHVRRERTDLRMAIDSARSAVLYGRTPSSYRVAPSVAAIVAIPVVEGMLQLPRVTTGLRPERPTGDLGRIGAIVPRLQQQRLAVHENVRMLLELGALFEAAPLDTALQRRVTRYVDGEGDIALTMEATRTSRWVRDTVVMGRRARVVRDSTVLAVRHAYLLPARFTKRIGQARETLRGTLVGVRLVDEESRLAFTMLDTLVMHGNLVSDDGFGGRVQSPLFVESARASSLRDSLWRAIIPREPFDMVRYAAPREAPTPAERDSLFVELGTAPSLATRDSIRTRITAWGDPGQFWPRVAARSLAVGDTASVIDWISGSTSGGRHTTITAGEYRLMRHALADANAAFRTGVDRELLVVNLIDWLLRTPPAVAPPDARPVCSPEACRAMAADAGNRSNLPLQAVGLVAAMVTSPAIWTDSVIMYSQRNPFLATRALWFARGASSTAVASAKAPIPLPNAPDSAWMHWMTGQDSVYVRLRNADTAMRRAAAEMNARRANAGRPITVDDGAAMAIRFAAVRTGMSYADVFRARRVNAATDSARALYGAMLIAMDEPVYSDAELVRIMLAPGSPEREAARTQLQRVRRLPLARASDSVTGIVGRHVVNMIFADSLLAMPAGDTRSANWYHIPESVDSLPRYVIMDSLPVSVRARATALGFAPVAEGWVLPPGSAGYLIDIDPIRQRGPFVLVSVSHTTLFARGQGRSGGYAGGFTLVLVEGPSGWVVVDANLWVT